MRPFLFRSQGERVAQPSGTDATQTRFFDFCAEGTVGIGKTRLEKPSAALSALRSPLSSKVYRRFEECAKRKTAQVAATSRREEIPMRNEGWRTWSYKDGFGAEIRGNEWAPLVLIPLLAAVMLVASVVLLIVFRQHPTLVITTVAGCLVVVTVYLTVMTVGNVSDTYE